MTILLTMLAAVLAVGVIVFMIRLAPGRTESVPRDGQHSEGQGEELVPQDRAA